MLTRLPLLVAVIAVAQMNVAGVSVARADGPAPQSSEADKLFREGKARLAAQDYTTACPLLAASFQKDAATGTLLALAMCHERQGDLNAALTEYRGVAERSRAEARTDRENAALVRIAALEQQLGVTAPAVTAPAVEAAPPQSEPVAAPTPEVAPEAIEPTVAAPEPTRTPSRMTEITPPRPRPATTTTRSTSDRINAMQVTGLAMVGVGVFALGTAGAFTIQAINKNNDSKDGCVVNRCTEAGRDDRLDARSAGTAATVSALIGGALATGGALMFFLLGDTETAPRASASVTPWLGHRSFGAAAQGTF